MRSRAARAVLGAWVAGAVLVAGGCGSIDGSPGSEPTVTTPTANSSPTSIPASVTDSGDSTGSPEAEAWSCIDDGEVVCALNTWLDELIRGAGYEPGGGDHDYLSGTDSIWFDDGSSVWLSVVPVERAELGDLTFEVDREVNVGEVSVAHGVLSDGQAAAFFDCGGFRFGVAGEVADEVGEVGDRTAAQVDLCPADVDELVALIGVPAEVRGPVAVMAAYLVAPDAVQLLVASCNGARELTELTQDDAQVRVEVTSTTTNPDDACQDTIEVALDAPLAARDLVDASSGRTVAVAARP